MWTDGRTDVRSAPAPGPIGLSADGATWFGGGGGTEVGAPSFRRAIRRRGGMRRGGGNRNSVDRLRPTATARRLCLSVCPPPSSLPLCTPCPEWVRACRICIRVSRAHTHASPRRTIRHGERGLGTATEERRREQTETAWIQWQRTHGQNHSPVLLSLPPSIHPSVRPSTQQVVSE